MPCRSWPSGLGSVVSGATLLLLCVASFLCSADSDGARGSLITEESERFTLYSVSLSDVPVFVTAEDFHVDLLGTQFVQVGWMKRGEMTAYQITVDGCDVEWKIRLHQKIPFGLIFYPEYSATLERLERTAATWPDTPFGARVYIPEVQGVRTPHVCAFGAQAVLPFTQGLLFTSEQTVLESSGLSSRSFLREFSASTGTTLRRANLPSGYFAEGTALVVEPSTLRLYVMVLTYTDNVILLYDYATFVLAYAYKMNYMGFGLTSNYDIRCKDLADFVVRQKVWMTTGGSDLISVSLPASFSDGALSIAGSVPITLNGRRLLYVNEMEYNVPSDTVYGNIWGSDYIVEINPYDGTCLALWDLRSLASQQPMDVDVLNGIACHPSKSYCMVTGKFWPHLYRVTLPKGSAKSVDVPLDFYDNFCEAEGATSSPQGAR
ncbi:glutamine cyclotransferase [Babesia ovata]|uniref:Glutamine cyclotransferase n=1 Tax=Babesia ovata TaxID=189622 RepID=A0A2H6KDU5_9APIC|nr:glutamine cyclotransferase [Babesia ovata]GBE61168.1 glutamine cyclotransferase [Babesia ovata]